MGIINSVYNYLGYGTGRTDDPDPVTGLTSRDKYLITKSWAVVKQDPTGSGVALFLVLFKNHPEYQQLFPFRDIPIKELANSTKFQAHGNSVIYSLSSVVDALNEDKLLLAVLTKLGESHVPRKVTEQGFIDLKEAVIELFSSLFNAEEMKAWTKALDVAFDVMIKAIREKIKADQE